MVVDPSTEEHLASVADCDETQALAALDAAAWAAAEWSAASPRERSEVLRRAHETMIRRRSELALLITLEMGKPLRDSLDEVSYAAEFLRWFAEEAVRVKGRYGSMPEGTGRMLVAKRPVRVCLITPWNFPLAMVSRKVAPALAAGCTAVVKPAAESPAICLGNGSDPA